MPGFKFSLVLLCGSVIFCPFCFADSPDTASDQTAFSLIIRQKIDSIVQEATTAPPETVSADEQLLPTAGLPALQNALSNPQTPPAAAKAIQAALANDDARLKRALAKKKIVDWWHDNTVAIFDQNADKNAPWYRDARSTVLAAVRLWSDDPAQTYDEDVSNWYSSQKAVAQRCDEALFLYACEQNFAAFGNDPRMLCQISRQTEHQMEASQYPPFLKGFSAFHTAARLADTNPDDKKEIDRLVQAGNGFFAQMISDPSTPREIVLTFFDIAAEASLSVAHDRRTLCAPLFDQLQKSQVDPSTTLTVQGAFNIDYAWDARGGGWANTVTDDGRRLMKERLVKADTALEQAWKLDPANTKAACLMLTVELGQGQGRDRLELWFKHAIDVDPELTQAYSNKMYYLEPKWYGSIDAMLAFGHQCSQSANPDSQVRLMIADAHRRAAVYVDDPQTPGVSKYFADNQAAWDDIHQVYPDFLAFHPDSNFYKLRYAHLAVLCGQWQEANRIFKQVNDVWDWRVYNRPKEQDDEMALAAQKAAAMSPTK